VSIKSVKETAIIRAIVIMEPAYVTMDGVASAVRFRYARMSVPIMACALQMVAFVTRDGVAMTAP
jgi:hypothetical protein